MAGGGYDVAISVRDLVVGFGDQRIHGLHVLVAGKAEHVSDERVGHAGGGKRGGQQNRRFNLAQLVDLRGAYQLAERIAHKDRPGNFFSEEIAAVGQDGGDSGAD